MRLHLPKTPQLQNHSSQLRIFISLWGHKSHSNYSTALEGFKESWCEHRSNLLGAGVHDAHRCLNLRIITNLIASGLQVSNFSFSSFTNGSNSLFWNSVCLLLLSIAWVNLFPKLSLFILLHIGEMYPLPWSHYQNLVRTAPFLTYITVSWCFIAVVISISLAVSYHWTPISMETLLQSNVTRLYRVWRSSSLLWYCKSSFYLSMQHLSSSGSSTLPLVSRGSGYLLLQSSEVYPSFCHLSLCSLYVPDWSSVLNKFLPIWNPNQTEYPLSKHLFLSPDPVEWLCSPIHYFSNLRLFSFCYSPSSLVSV